MAEGLLFRFSGWAGGNSGLVARAAEKSLNSDLMAGGNSDLVACTAETTLDPDVMGGGYSYLAADLQGTQI